MHRIRYQILLFTFVRTVINTMYRMVYPFLPVFVRGIGVDLQAMSLALTGRSVIGAAGPFLAAIADSRGRKIGLLAGMGMFCLGVGLVAVQPGFLTFTLALLVTSLGKAIFDPAVHAYLGDRVPYRRRGAAIGLVEIGWSFSFIFGVPIMGLLIGRLGWVAPFPLLTGLGLLCVAAVAWMVPADAPARRAGGLLGRNLRSILTHRPALAGLATGLMMTSGNEMVNLVFGVWLEDTLQLQIAALGAASLLIGLAELGGEGLVTGLTDRLGKQQAIAAGLVLNSLAALALPVLGRSPSGAFVGLFLFFITFEFTLVSIIPLMTELLPGARATLVGANVASLSLGRALGALLGPPVYSVGIVANAGVAVIFNLLALAALRGVRFEGEGD